MEARSLPWGRRADGEAAEAPGRHSRPRPRHGEPSYTAADVGHIQLSPKQLLSSEWVPWAVPGLALGGGHPAGRQWGGGLEEIGACEALETVGTSL